MPTAICSHCSKVVSAEGPLPDHCPVCGGTLHIEHDSTRSRPQLCSTVIQEAEQRPTMIGRYIVERRLGDGGFGWVYLAYDPQLDRQVAIKVPRRDTGTTPAALKRFAQEGRAAAQLRHPGIISVFNVEDDGELPFIVSEYVEGKPLSDRLREDPRDTFRETAQLVAAIASAVDYAHSKRIIHRDIKPSNVIIATDGTPRLTDFGLAKRETMENSRLTGDHHILGTPAYMSPEQAWGKRGKVDRRTDIYSLGTVLYELLTREIPFRGAPRMVLRQLVEDEPRKPRSLNDEIPLDLETICQKAMDKDASKRFQTAGELSAELNRWLRHEPILTRPITQLERGWRWCRRNPLVAGLVTTIALLLMTVACSALVVAGQERKAADTNAHLAHVEKEAHAAADVAKQKAVEKADELARLNRELSEMVSKSYVEHGSQYLGWNDESSDYSPLKALPWFEAAMEIDDKHPTRREASRLRMGALLRSTPSVNRAWSHGGLIKVLAVSPKGDRFFTGGLDGSGRLWSPTQELPIASTLTHPAQVLSAAFSPNGTLLLTGCEGGVVRAWETMGGKLVYEPLQVRPQAPGEPPIAVRSIAFSLDGRLFLTVTDHDVRVFETDGLKPVGRPLAGPMVQSAQFASRGRLLVTKTTMGPISVWDVQTGAEKGRLIERSQPGNGVLAVAAEGNTIAAAQSPESIGFWDCETGKKLEVPVLNHHDAVLSAVFSADASQLATGTADGTVSVWKVADGKRLLKTRPGRANVLHIDFIRQDLPLIITYLDEADRWDSVIECETGKMVSEPLHNYSGVGSTQRLGDSTHLLTAGGPGTVRLWDLQIGDSAFRCSTSSDFRGTAVSADGSTVVARGDIACLVLRSQSGQPFSDKSVQEFKVASEFRPPAISADGSRLAVTDSVSTVAILDAHSGQSLSPRLEHYGQITRLVFTPKADLLIVLSQDRGPIPQKCRVTSWDVKSFKRQQQCELGRIAVVSDLDVRKQDGLCVIAADHHGLVWDPRNGQTPRSILAQVSAISTCRFSPDGQLIVTGGVDGVARIWDTASAKQRAATPRTPGTITCADFSPDGASFVTGHSNGTVRIWRVADANSVTGSLLHGAAPSRCVFSPDGRWLVTLSDRPLPDRRPATTVHGWDARTGELVFTRVIDRFAARLHQDSRRAPRNPWTIAAAFFSPDRQFNVLTAGGLFVTFDLSPDARPLTQVAREVNLRSGASFDRMGGLSFDGAGLSSSMSTTQREKEQQ